MRSVGEVRRSMLGLVHPTGTEAVLFDEAAGRILAVAVVAPHDVPSFANSAMDGYAVRGSDVASAGSVLEVVDDIAAGRASTVVVGHGQAARIMTGAPMPAGADTVVRVEDTDAEDGKVHISVATEVGTSVRPPGGDVSGGSTVFHPGVRLTAGHVGVLATIGVTQVEVAKRPRVAVMSTGDELVPASTPSLAPGMIRDSNRPMLMQLVADAGADPVDMGSIPDDADALRAALGEAAALTDLIVTSGGVSMGEYDVTKMVLLDEASVEFFPVAMKPGKPQGFGSLGGKPFFGLPGNPVSVHVSFEQFVRPALLTMQGAAAILRPRVLGVAGEDLESDPAKEEYLRVRLASADPGLRVVRTGGQGSHVISGVANADAFAVLEVGVAKVAEGDPVLLELFRSDATRGLSDG